ncbi:hypothetical protein [Bradyrhizobium sp. CCBAU 53380]|uniref:hypothetical protein n=1 Tax=Bradyrhizobium sp. CCBAU 53380 TaxID=1325117 RepID=UPI002304CC6B|nr:hypothetical protein [Bradyrhizobium sp. CCBAU 53380]MDA9424018.1 hypothetical protein [Bradyrhizobium sp. CCBAU 53380]
MGNIKAALDQLDFIEKIEYHDKEGNFDFDKDWSKPASSFGISQVQESLTKLEHTLAAEFEKTATYLVSKTNSFDTETLIERAIETFPPEVRAELNEMACYDFKEAGKCLGFGLFTAAGFHLARATEAVMADYCRTFDVEVTKKATWGTLLAALSACTGDMVPDKSTISILEQIKNVDRNDLMHPRKTLSLTDATRLFHLATGAIIAMTLEIRSKVEKAAQGTLVLEAPPPALLPQSSPQPVKAASQQ